MFKIFGFLFLTVFSLRIYAGGVGVMKIKMTSAEGIIHAKLENNPTSSDFFSQLPLTVKLDDYASAEKIFYPPKKLITEAAPRGYQPENGDITYYAPWGNIAIFYKSQSFASGLVYLGKITTGLDILKKYRQGTVLIERDE